MLSSGRVERCAHTKRAFLRASLATLLLCICAPVAHGQVYQWVDENGQIRFSDTPPPNARRQDVRIQGESGVEAASGGGHASLSVIPYTGDRPSRSIRLAPVIFALDVPPGTTVEVGQILEGPYCRPARSLSIQAGERFEEADVLPRRFSLRLRELGYRTPDDALVRFERQGHASTDLVLTARVVGLELERCYSAYGNQATKESTWLRVDWELNDPTLRKVLYRATTEGSDSGAGDARTPRADSRSLADAFGAAVERILADPDFAAQLDPEVHATAAVPASPARTPLNLALRKGSNDTAFSHVVSQLTAATVTIRHELGHGTGFLVADGFVVTNHHVIDRAHEIRVLTAQGEIRAEVIRQDRVRDVALLRLSQPISAAPLALAARRPRTGDTVYVMGTPLDISLSHTTSKGTISGERFFNGLRYYQTDAAINPGNSGGPVFDEHGNVVALAVAGIFDREGAGLRVNYLIPIEDALGSLGLQ